MGLASGAVAIAAGGLLALKASRSAPRPALPDYGALPSFTLTNQDALAFGTDQLIGRVWIANFIFTRCPTICPVFTRKMVQVQSNTSPGGDAVRLVSFSVDPDFDQPPILKAYAEKHRADPKRWTFLTGRPDDLKRVVIDGLKQAMGREGPADDLNSIFHGTHFVLVDQSGHIRGYYRSEDDGVLERLSADALALAQHTVPKS